MPLKNGGITAKTVEDFKRCEEGLAHLNSLIVTLNGKEISVYIEPAFIGKGILVRPIVNSIGDIRVKAKPTDDEDGFWVDFSLEKKAIYIRAGEMLIYTIFLEPK